MAPTGHVRANRHHGPCLALGNNCVNRARPSHARRVALLPEVALGRVRTRPDHLIHLRLLQVRLEPSVAARVDPDDLHAPTPECSPVRLLLVLDGVGRLRGGVVVQHRDHHLRKLEERGGRPRGGQVPSPLLVGLGKGRAAHEVEGDAVHGSREGRGWEVSLKAAVNIVAVLIHPGHEDEWDGGGRATRSGQWHVRSGLVVEELELLRADVADAQAERPPGLVVELLERDVAPAAHLLADQSAEVVLQEVALEKTFSAEEASHAPAKAAGAARAVEEVTPRRGCHDLLQLVPRVAHRKKRGGLGARGGARKVLYVIQNARLLEALDTTCVHYAFGATALEDHRLGVPAVGNLE
mmetsp:Transcript_47393/g.148919  ORF Transcript_47393/g.148919 Transcript_47393/m.148919 type:complete len:353 (-) Transcript_47393:157-1215(-)